jgi:hypothetical protein
MRPTAWILGAAFALVSAVPAASVVITSDNGGQIGAYVARYSKVRQSGERVVIDGDCLSACTIVVGMIPPERLCATRNAVLGFHAAWLPDGEGRVRASRDGTEVLMKFYPPSLRRWIAQRGGLNSRLTLLRGRELAAIVPPCAASAGPARTGRDARTTQARPSRRAPATIAPPASAEAAILR